MWTQQWSPSLDTSKGSLAFSGSNIECPGKYDLKTKHSESGAMVYWVRMFALQVWGPEFKSLAPTYKSLTLNRNIGCWEQADIKSLLASQRA